MKTHAYVIPTMRDKFGVDHKYSLVNSRTREILLSNSTPTEIKNYIAENDTVIIAGREYL